MKALVIVLVAGIALPASAQAPRTPDQRQTLLDLAFVLGEAHGLRAACKGPQDQAWRARMTALIEVEKPDEPFRRTLVSRFNAGYAARRAQVPTCLDDTPAEERATAERGRSLAAKLGTGG